MANSMIVLMKTPYLSRTGGDGLAGRVHRGGFEHHREAGEVDTAEQEPDGRHDHVRHQRVDDLAEG